MSKSDIIFLLIVFREDLYLLRHYLMPSYTLSAYIIMFYFCILVDILYFNHMINTLCIAMPFRKTFQHRKRQERKKQERKNQLT